MRSVESEHNYSSSLNVGENKKKMSTLIPELITALEVLRSFLSAKSNMVVSLLKTIFFRSNTTTSTPDLKLVLNVLKSFIQHNTNDIIPF